MLTSLEVNTRPFGLFPTLCSKRSSCTVSAIFESCASFPDYCAALNTKERLFYEDVSVDPRFTSEAAQSQHRSVFSLPIFSNRGQTFGAVYLAAKYAFSSNTVAILTLLCQQVSVSIANALLFRSVQAGTRENLKMIASQKEALDQARIHREEAEKATKVNFSPIICIQPSAHGVVIDQKQLSSIYVS